MNGNHTLSGMSPKDKKLLPRLPSPCSASATLKDMKYQSYVSLQHPLRSIAAVALTCAVSAYKRIHEDAAILNLSTLLVVAFLTLSALSALRMTVDCTKLGAGSLNELLPGATHEVIIVDN